MKRILVRDFKVFFFRGLAVMLPVMLSLTIIIAAFNFIREHVGQHLDEAVQWVVIQIRSIIYANIEWSLKGSKVEWDQIEGFWEANGLAYIGIALAFVLVYVVGRFMATFVGRSVLRLLERGLGRLPLIRLVYPLVKQVTDYFFSDHKIEFSRVVVVEYPRKGVWSMGLVTAGGMRTLCDAIHGDLLTVFIPSSPTPVTGYTITVRKDDVIDLPLTIDEAFKFTISGGVIQPPSQMTDSTVSGRLVDLPNSSDSKEIEA
ncbi:MAG: DUF502 domain-containing protein [Planctomycetota bacterium]